MGNAERVHLDEPPARSDAGRACAGLGVQGALHERVFRCFCCWCWSVCTLHHQARLPHLHTAPRFRAPQEWRSHFKRRKKAARQAAFLRQNSSPTWTSTWLLHSHASCPCVTEDSSTDE